MKHSFLQKRQQLYVDGQPIAKSNLNIRDMATKRTYIRLNTGLLPHAMLLTVMLVGCFTALAEATEYKKILTEGKTWVYTNGNISGGWYDLYTGTKYVAKVVGDTVVYSIPAKKILIKYEHPDKEGFKDKPKTGEYIRIFAEENGIIFEPTDDNSSLLYVDMDVDNNPTPEIGVPVLSVDYIDSPMGKLKRIFMGEAKDIKKNEIYPLCMIEGVGSSNTLITPDGNKTDGGGYERMTAFYYNDALVFTEEDFSPFPVGVEEIDVEKATPGNDDAPYYDLMGQRVKNPVPGSILIHNGCKIVYR